jgi:hypothetical protein
LFVSSPSDAQSPPIAIGGVGGSGTRLVAQILRETGFYIGDDLNESNDNLWFTLLFKRQEILSSPDEEFERLVEIFLDAMTKESRFSMDQVDRINKLASVDRPEHPKAWLKERVKSLLAGRHGQRPGRVAWKEPNTHIVIDRLQKHIHDIKYVHVVRNGLDMAHSANQNQLKFWGARFIGPDCGVTPFYSLKYWHTVHERVLRIGHTMGARFLFLNYDQFCLEPAAGIRQLLSFLEVAASDSLIRHLSDLVRPPRSIGRFKEYGLSIFDPGDVAFVKELGFDIAL